jgi:subtilisin family serine protease
VTLPRPNRRALVVGIALATVATMVGIGSTALAGTTDPGAPTGASPSIKHPAKPPKGHSTKASAVVKDSYIVVLKDKKASKSTVHAQSATLTTAFGGKVSHEYSRTLRGYAASMTRAQATRLAADSRVAYVEPNRVISADDTQTNPPSWGIDRIDQTFLGLSRSYTPPTSGAGVHAYVIDSGIRITHNDFGGRATYGYDFVDNDTIADDCLGHGTHVAGIIGGTAYGVAKSVDLVAVRVLDCSGAGTLAGVIAGVEWVTTNAVHPAVANMSLGGPVDSESPALDAAVEASIASGITYAVAAGNEADNACNHSPADTPNAITVGATNIADFRADFSNFGSCVDVFAPGMSITSDFNTSDTATLTEGGTSMASPHVDGAAALLLAADSTLTPAQITAQIKNSAVPMAVHFAGDGSPNLLLNVNGTRRATTFGLRAHANNMYVTADPSGNNPLISSRVLVNGWELFDAVPVTGDYVALRAHANGKYVSADSAGAKPLIANRTAVGEWEQFKIVSNADGSIAIQAKANGKYVSADNGGKSALIANRTTPGSWETFDESGQAASILIKAAANGKYVTAENGGAKPLIANRTVPGGWELFDVADMLDGFVALRSHANGNFVTANPNGKVPLIANRAAVGGWEQFYWFAWTGTQSAFFALSNIDWVTADNAGNSPLINNRPTGLLENTFIPPGGWEIFYVS